jgi:hypothetical protein
MNEQISYGASQDPTQAIAKRRDALYDPDHTGDLKSDGRTGESFLQTKEVACCEQAEAMGGANRAQGALKPWPWIERMARTILFWTIWQFQANDFSNEIVQVLLVLHVLDQNTAGEPIDLDLHYSGSA